MKLYANTVCIGLIVMVCFDKPPPKPVVVSEYCTDSRTIIASHKDTPETLAQIRAENAKRRKLCPKL